MWVAAVPGVFLGIFIPMLFIVVFLNLLRSRRGDARLRCWIAGWIFAIPAVTLPSAGILSSDLRVLAYLIILCKIGVGTSFLMSAPAHRGDIRGAVYAALGLGVPAVLCATLIIFKPTPVWPACAITLVATLAGVALIYRRAKTGSLLSLLFALPLIFCGAWLISFLLRNEPGLALSVIVTEFLAANAVAQSINHKRKSFGLWISVLGYVSWTFATVAVAHLLRYTPQVSYSFPAEIVLGVGMMLLLMEESLFEARRLAHNFQTIFESSPHMMWMIDPATLRIITANQAAAEGHGYSLEDFEQLCVTDLIEPHTVEQIAEEVRSPLPKMKRPSTHRRKSGGLFPIDIEGRTVQIDGKQRRLVIGMDVTEREDLLSRLREQALTDPLTGLLNRSGFHAVAEQSIEQIIAAGHIAVLISFNIRQFKSVNDIYGEQVGDRCMKAIADRLRGLMVPGDFAGRTGGDEFKVLCSRPEKTAEELANCLLDVLTEPYPIDEVSIRLAFNMGVVAAPEDGTDANTLRRKVLSAMVLARSTHSQRPCRFSAEDAAAAQEALRLAEAIREMLQNDSFQVHYQPICAPDGTVKSLEALIRMYHPELGNVSPAKFIPVAEETRLIIPLGQWVFEHVCRQLSTWAKEGIPIVPVAVNISALQFRSFDFGSNILRTVEAFHLPKNLIYLELTESTVLRNLTESLEAMRSIASSGIRFAIDDFGTGYSSLGRLRDMPISTLKIDRSFIQKLRPNDTLVEAIISLAHALQMDVVAEGVETREQLDILRTLGCDSIQGYLLGRPAPPEETARILRKGTLMPQL